MAGLFAKTGGNFSELTFYKIAGSAYTSQITLGYSSYGGSLTTPQYIAITPTENGTMKGAVVFVKGYANSAGTVTCTLQQYSGGSWADVSGATKTLTYAEFLTNYSGASRGTGWVYFEFATPAAITNAANTWRLKMSSVQGFYLPSSTADLGWAVVLDDATAIYNSGDDLYIMSGQQVTQDEDTTFTHLFLGIGSSWVVPSTIPSNRTLTCTGLWYSSGAKLVCGQDDAHRIPYSSQLSLNITALRTFQGYSNSNNYEIELWGEKPTYYFTMISGDFSSGQAVFNTAEDMSSYWQNGDILLVGGRNHASLGFEQMTVSSVSAKQITCTGNFASPHWNGYIVINRTRAILCGVKFAVATANNTSYGGWARTNISGVHMPTTNIGVTFYSSSDDYDLTRIQPFYIDTVIATDGAMLTVGRQNYYTSYFAGGTFKYFFHITNTYHGNGNGIQYGDSIDIHDIYALDNGASSNYKITFSYVSSSTIYNIQGCGSHQSAYSNLNFAVTNCNVSNIKAVSGVPILNLAAINSTFDEVEIEYANRYAIQVSGPTINTTFTNCNIGQKRESGYGDIFVTTGIFCQLVFTDSTFTSGKEIYTIADSIADTYIRMQNICNVTNDNRTWTLNGNIQSTGDDLTDTTTYTSGTGKYALRLAPTSSVKELEWSFTSPTGNILGKTMSISIWVKINSAIYYAGTHTNPTLTINYDNGTELSSTATNSTEWQQLSVTFTPTTAYKEVTVTVSGKTDATGSDAYFYIDDIDSSYPSGTVLDLKGLDVWTNGMPITPHLLPTTTPVSWIMGMDGKIYVNTDKSNDQNKFKWQPV